MAVTVHACIQAAICRLGKLHAEWLVWYRQTVRSLQMQLPQVLHGLSWPHWRPACADVHHNPMLLQAGSTPAVAMQLARLCQCEVTSVLLRLQPTASSYSRLVAH